MIDGNEVRSKNENDDLSTDWGSSSFSSSEVKTVPYNPSPPADNFLNRTMILTLSSLAVFGVVASVMLPVFGLEVSDFLISITSACVGALVMSVRSWRP